MKLIFYEAADGKSPALEVIKTLGRSERAKIFGCLESIELLGFDTPRVKFRHIEGKLWEIKIRTVFGAIGFSTSPFRKARLFYFMRIKSSHKKHRRGKLKQP